MIFLIWLFSNLLLFQWIGDKFEEAEFRKYMKYWRKYK